MTGLPEFRFFKYYFTHSCEMLDHASFLRIPRSVGILIHCSGGRFLIFFWCKHQLNRSFDKVISVYVFHNLHALFN